MFNILHNELSATFQLHVSIRYSKIKTEKKTIPDLNDRGHLSFDFQLTFLSCRLEDKMAVLLHLLRSVIKPAEQTVIFAATKHHVEYIYMILCEAGMECSYSYSSLDQTARKIQVCSKCHMTPVTRKQTLRSLSLSYQKEDGLAWSENFPVTLPHTFLNAIALNLILYWCSQCAN